MGVENSVLSPLTEDRVIGGGREEEFWRVARVGEKEFELSFGHRLKLL